MGIKYYFWIDIYRAIASFINGEIELGIIAVVLARLFSPYGLPYKASKLIIGIESLNLKIKSI